MLVRLAWRNLWRQKRRTLLTASSIALALFLSLLMRSFQEGQYTSNIENNGKSGVGIIQLQDPDFRDSESIDELLPSTEAFIHKARKIDNIDAILPRIHGFSLASVGSKSKGVLVNGIAPNKETDYTHLADKLISGQYLHVEDTDILLAEGVAQYFNVSVGDEFVLYGQGYRGQTAAGVFTVKGILSFPMRELNNSQVYLSLNQAQILFRTNQQVTSWVVSLHSLDAMAQTVEELQNAYPDVSVRDWMDLSPELEQSIVLDRVSGLIMMYLLYGIVGFGLFATLLMMTLERQREFAVMLATGLVRMKLLLMVFIESWFIGLFGVVIGASLAVPIIVYFYQNPIRLSGDLALQMLEMGYEPIMPVSISPELVVSQIWIVAVMLLICLLYPMWRIVTLDIVSGLKGGAHAH
ncbi:ABC transporter permease [Marinomonas algarum]|uniref:ABC transporter permease n=1 Tax=Marinomonas algarum TaxID=2883105 RepID=A0A9X1INR6_9GAMM|nr:ABC transporter permease [Marinomonas algarum]MCB5161691.1 ABC transporter permease [Marinomonas algarum]